jgi:excisionase family DNA binding protein
MTAMQTNLSWKKERVLTPSEAAAILMVSRDTVRRAADRGQLTTYRTPGGQRRFRLADVEEFRDRLAGDASALAATGTEVSR